MTNVITSQSSTCAKATDWPQTDKTGISNAGQDVLALFQARLIRPLIKAQYVPKTWILTGKLLLLMRST